MVRATSTRKNRVTTGNPYTGTARSHRSSFLGDPAFPATVAILFIIAPSIRFLSRARGLLLHDPSDSCGSPAPGPHTAGRATRSTDIAASANAGFFQEWILYRIPEGRDLQTERGRDREPAFHRCQFPHKPCFGSSAADFPGCGASPRPRGRFAVRR